MSIQPQPKNSPPREDSWQPKVGFPAFHQSATARPKERVDSSAKTALRNPIAGIHKNVEALNEALNETSNQSQSGSQKNEAQPGALTTANSFSIFQPTLAERLQLVSEWGRFSLAWSIGVQEGLSYFGNGQTMVGFAKKWGNVYVLADPIGPPELISDLLDAFLLRFPKACFVQCQNSTASLLEARGYYLNEMGVDTHLDLTEYNFSGKQKEPFRYAGNWLERRGFQIIEDQGVATNQKAAAEISAAWRATRTVKHREVAFLNRPLDLDSEWDHADSMKPKKSCSAAISPFENADDVDAINSLGVRRFYLVDADGKRVAFVFFDPIFEFGNVVGYVTSFKRRHPDAPAHAELGITKHAIEVFQSEDIRSLYLGLSPLAEIENLNYRKNPFLHFSFRYLFGSSWFNRFVYPLKGHAEFKQKFRGQTEKVYFASRTIVNDLRLFGLLKLCRVI